MEAFAQARLYLALMLVPVGVGCAKHAATTPNANVPTVTHEAVALSARDFGALVAHARAAENEPLPDDAPPCLLSGPDTQDRWQVGALFASPLRPLPAAPEELFTQLVKRGARVTMLTPHGAEGENGMPFVALTPLDTAPGERAHIVIITHAGVFMRAIGASSDAGPMSVEELGSAAAETLHNAPVYVTAEAAISLATLARVLQALSTYTTRIAFALALPADTTLPSPPLPDAGAATCGEVPDVARQGALPPATLRAGLESLGASARTCYEALPAYDQHAGNLRVRVTVDEHGRVSDSCIASTEFASSRLHTCLVQESHRLSFTKPSPPGRVVFVAPLRFVPIRAPLQRPYCPRPED